MLALDPHRKDAGLIVGTYRYIVATLALPVRWVAYVAGFGGGRERGMRLIEEAAAYGGDNQTDARFALILLYNREKRYDDALKQLARLREEFPTQPAGVARERLDRASRGPAGRRRTFPERRLRALRRRSRARGCSARTRCGTTSAAPRAPGSDGRPTPRPICGRRFASEGRNWVHGRTHLELGKLALKAGNKDAARVELRAAATLGDSDNDPATADEARRLRNRSVA